MKKTILKMVLVNENEIQFKEKGDKSKILAGMLEYIKQAYQEKAISENLVNDIPMIIKATPEELEEITAERAIKTLEKLKETLEKLGDSSDEEIAEEIKNEE